MLSQAEDKNTWYYRDTLRAALHAVAVWPDDTFIPLVKRECQKILDEKDKNGCMRSAFLVLFAYHSQWCYDMIEKAFAQIPDGTNLILHSDQGWQYQMYDYQRRLKEKGIRQSMSRKGNCLDNSVMENFFGLLKSELLYLQDFESVEHFKKELIEYLSWYNEKRIKVKLKGLTPLQFRNQSLKSA